MTAIRAGALGLAVALAIGCDSSPTTRTREAPEASPAAAAPMSPPPVAPSAAPTTSPGSLVVSCQAAPRNGAAPLRVEFSSSASGGTAAAYEYEWSFGDGGSSTNPDPAHTYTAPGTFEAAVSVTSGADRGACSRTITVTGGGGPAGPAPPPPGPSPTPTPAPTPTPNPSPTPSPTPPPPPGRTLTLTTSGFNWFGSAYTNPGGIFCTHPPACTATATFAHGTVVTVVGSAGGDPIARVTISGACSATGQGAPVSCQVVMDADKSVDVWFFRASLVPFAGGYGTGR